MKHPASLRLDADGAQLFEGVVRAEVPRLLAILNPLPQERAGVRIAGVAPLRPCFDRTGPIGSIASVVLGARSRAVRAILFDKSPAMNWSLGWHQDRTICVRERRDWEGFGPWTVKGGMQHVCPPTDLLSRMVTLRVHLDDVSEANAPLLIAPSSHRLGRIAEADIADAVRSCGTATCVAEAGDVWLYATLILHASEAAATPRRRRVLQIDFAAEELPGGLEWTGV